MTRNLLSLLAFLIALCATAAAAQEEATAFDLSLANPGARSLGFGGAFLALADDATAAFANPAGLGQLLEPELTFEIRGQLIPTAESRDDPLVIASEEEGTLLAFGAFVYPWKRWAVAAYSNGFANAAEERLIQGAAATRAFSIVAFNEFMIDSTGLSASYRLTEDLSIGAGVALWEGTLTAVRDSTLTGEGFLGPGERRLTVITTTDDADLSFNAGILWRFADQWRLAGVYRGGPEFSLLSEVSAGTLPLDQLPVTVRRFPFLLPDTLGLGVAYKTLGETLTLSFEWDLVRYSRLLDSLDSPDRSSFELDDGHELHLGFEYVIVRSRPVIALRLGAWREPAHRLRYLGGDPVNRATFRGGEEESHFAMGFGLAFDSLKLDFAFDDADRIKTGSFTMIYSF